MIKCELWKNNFLREPNVSFSDVVSILDGAFVIFTIERNWTIWKNELDGKEVKLRSGDYTNKNTNIVFPANLTIIARSDSKFFARERSQCPRVSRLDLKSHDIPGCVEPSSECQSNFEPG